MAKSKLSKLVPCPNRGKPLMRLPKDYPLYDLQCTGCLFRVQVKTNNSRPKKEVLGAGYNVLEKALKVGIVMPPLIINFVWAEANIRKQRILFYPFIPKSHIKVRELRARPGYRMYNYIDLDKLPYFVLYEDGQEK